MLLALDTSTAQVGLALYDGTQVIGELFWHSRAHHTSQLAPALAELLARAGVKIDEIKALGVALGPGSFTSLRVGLALAKGLALARHLPMIGIPTLDILAFSQPVRNVPLAAVLQAGRGRLAVGWYRASENGWQAEGPAAVTTADDLAQSISTPTLVCGELTAENRQRLARKFKNITLASPAGCVRRPGILAEIAWQKWQAGKVDPAASLAPIYLHVAGGIPA
ncbi:MAG: tRNA (adenosine(37)-N6)-threonylcarbamoyltransferase complex dimerization subunit type 1 TsaB [Anaerolineales bacterium]|nr:tRNA (adenosine(37)-N6)-threonylcarbamoyltransferase complex dimerization subunit type 1 TsaB [Anaerolineales bacterium]MDP3185191.1 tRNA (adenosine(37)-N6)-threonylcarbamoyltransferase complex dimerization subunit type 1 TsaB [Anaerolineales bacterium]